MSIRDALSPSRKVMKQERIDLVLRFLDEHIPVASGRSFRLQTETDDFLFRQYEEWISSQGRTAVSKTFFTEKVSWVIFVLVSKRSNGCVGREDAANPS